MSRPPPLRALAWCQLAAISSVAASTCPTGMRHNPTALWCEGPCDAASDLVAVGADANATPPPPPACRSMTAGECSGKLGARGVWDAARERCVVTSATAFTLCPEGYVLHRGRGLCEGRCREAVGDHVVRVGDGNATTSTAPLCRQLTTPECEELLDTRDAAWWGRCYTRGGGGNANGDALTLHNEPDSPRRWGVSDRNAVLGIGVLACALLLGTCVYVFAVDDGPNATRNRLVFGTALVGTALILMSASSIVSIFHFGRSHGPRVYAALIALPLGAGFIWLVKKFFEQKQMEATARKVQAEADAKREAQEEDDERRRAAAIYGASSADDVLDASAGERPTVNPLMATPPEHTHHGHDPPAQATPTHAHTHARV